ncbi:MAG: hypothetical protein J6Q82_08065 [Clostridia bacterium]|nr:hypothetical protein [Clostridia bacterium]
MIENQMVNRWIVKNSFGELQVEKGSNDQAIKARISQRLIKKFLTLLDPGYRMTGSIEIQKKNKFANSTLREKRKGVLQGI